MVPVSSAMNSLFHLPYVLSGYVKWVKRLGQIFHFVWNHVGVVGGIGENLHFIDRSRFNCHLLIVKPKKGVSKEMF